MSVSLLRVDMLQLAVEHEIGSERTESDSDATTEHGVGEDGAILSNDAAMRRRSANCDDSAPPWRVIDTC